MRVSDHILQRLSQEGVDRIFMVYGAAMGEIADAIYRQNAIAYTAPHHEQAAGFMAEGYQKAGKPLGVALVTSGPGVGNLVTPMQNCFYDSVPCLFISGQGNSRFLRPTASIRQLGFQETDALSIASSITKYAAQVRDPKRIRYELEKAIWYAKEGRPGPVLLDIPIDVQKSEIDPASLDVWAPAKPKWDTWVTEDAIGAYLKDLATAQRPVLLIGGGCQNYKEEFHALAERLQIPCFATWNAMDIVTSDSPFYCGRVGTYGGAGRNFGIQNSDLVLFIGSRISGRITGGVPDSFTRNAKRYVVDVDAALLEPKWQPVKAHVNIYCDAGVFMRSLANRAVQPNTQEWLKVCRDWREKYDPVREEFREGWHTYGFLRTLSELMPPNAVIVNDTGGAVISAAHAFETKRGQRYFTNNGNTPMGFAFPAAMGAYYANPSRPVFCISGDGGFQLNSQELQTLYREHIPVRTFILNNRILGNTAAYQDANYQGRRIACGPEGYSPPDFVRVAKAYNIPAYRIDKKWDRANYSYQRNTMDEWLPRLMATPGPWICDVQHDGFCTYEPRMTSWQNPVEDMLPYLPRDEFRRNLIGVEPWEGWEKNT